MIDIEKVVEGKSYACRFSIITACDSNGQPVPNLSGNTDIADKKYESLGIIVQRDQSNNLVRLIDEPSRLQFIVPFENIWDIDEIEWVDEIT